MRLPCPSESQSGHAGREPWGHLRQWEVQTTLWDPCPISLGKAIGGQGALGLGFQSGNKPQFIEPRPGLASGGHRLAKAAQGSKQGSPATSCDRWGSIIQETNRQNESKLPLTFLKTF